jgi:hypothetical protein
MTVDVLVLRESGGEYRATVLGWPECTAIAPSRQEAIQRTRESLKDLLAQAEIVQLDVDAPSTSSALARFAGMWAQDETLDEFVVAMEAYRREVDTDESQP